MKDFSPMEGGVVSRMAAAEEPTTPFSSHTSNQNDGLHIQAMKEGEGKCEGGKRRDGGFSLWLRVGPRYYSCRHSIQNVST